VQVDVLDCVALLPIMHFALQQDIAAKTRVGRISY
jgi:hypothetical protein